jgi:hypothetical protein
MFHINPPRIFGGNYGIREQMERCGSPEGYLKIISPQSPEYLHSIIEARQNTKSLILISNRALPDCGAVFPDPIIDNVILDRIAYNAHHIIIKGESYKKIFVPKTISLDSYFLA